MSAATSKSAIACQARRKAQGLCIRCGQPQHPKSKNHCKRCRALCADYTRNRYRAKQGIPLDAPMAIHGKKRAQHRLCTELAAAFTRAISRITQPTPTP